MSSIALRYKAEVQEINRINKLTDSSPIHSGDILTIPGGSLPISPTPPVKVARERRSEAISPAERVVRDLPKPPSSTALGNYVWPTSGRHITQYFGYRHTGIDIDGQIGSPIYAITNGTVEFSGWATGYGLSIVVNHGNGIWSRYGHNSKIYVRIGDTVTKGATIALMGTTGKSTGSHLHFEILTGTRKYQNPLKYIKK